MNTRDNTITIYPGGNIEHKTHRYSEDAPYDINQDVTYNAGDILFLDCIFEPNLKVRDLFTVVENNLELFSSILPYHIEEFLKESKIPIDIKIDRPDSKLEFAWANVHDLFDDTSEYYSNVSLSIVVPDDEMKYGVDFLPANILVDMIAVQNVEYKVNGQFEASGQQYDFGIKYFNLLDIIQNMFYDISFYGPPERREENIKTIKENIE